PSHPLSEFFDLDTVVNNGRVFSQYPPGHTVLLMLGDWIGAPWLVGPVLGAATVPALYALGKQTYGESTGRLAAFLLVLSPFFLLMSGEFYNHTSSFLFLTLFLLHHARFTESPDRRTAVGAGLWLGLALLSRPLTALAVSAPCALHTLLTSLRKRDTRRWQAVGLGAATVLVFVGVLLLYNRQTTGAFFSFAYGQAVGPGFGFSEEIDWMRSLSRVIAMNNDLLGWALPGLALPLFVFLRAKTEPWDYLFAAVFFALVLAYLPAGYPDREFGPRYLYESLGALLLLSARGLLTIHEGLGRLAGRSLQRDRVRQSAGAMVGVTFLLTFILAWPPRLELYDSPQWRWAYRDDVVTSVRSRGIENALVFVEGERIWASTFLANRLDFDTASVIYARNLGERNVELMRYYPGRSYFLADSTGLEPLWPD
ncbi:MAG TPA: glycosyltransferase family 39 protein, partial [Longimicrobiales bacterium]|nr:glycosyltransferase family 39 protein [Longimicrobiales bacterium]